MRVKHKDPILFRRAQVLTVQSFDAFAGAAMLAMTVILAWPSLTRRRCTQSLGGADRRNQLSTVVCWRSQSVVHFWSQKLTAPSRTSRREGR
jgi:hypothetical protein